ncbi:TA system VapC family ribonuclease toxin [Methylopila sp. 73B]|uniref:TA system VapC family ribonuclease toxin n=1 Tax=Methylopila sp. 73B TaxID=1120792 RepID=UPI0003718F72|nr:TA system VapC family ribonuclease toxin [Methylopila sp. 73B]
MSFLLDVSVLIALIDSAHAESQLAHDWFAAEGRHDWATCPIVENGVLRIVSQPSYLNSPGSPAIVATLLRTFFAMPGHRFWADDVSLLADDRVDVLQLSSHRRVTDTYLLALAVKNGGRFVTLDRRLAPDAVSRGREALVVI